MLQRYQQLFRQGLRLFSTAICLLNDMISFAFLVA
jgi:hypothetical protein